MMYLDDPPRLIGTEVFSAMPDNFSGKGAATSWADANRPGQPTDCFIEGPSFDAEGHLYIVDIPFGRIFRIAPDGTAGPTASRFTETDVFLSPTICTASWSSTRRRGRCCRC